MAMNGKFKVYLMKLLQEKSFIPKNHLLQRNKYLGLLDMIRIRCMMKKIYQILPLNYHLIKRMASFNFIKKRRSMIERFPLIRMIQEECRLLMALMTLVKMDQCHVLGSSSLELLMRNIKN